MDAAQTYFSKTVLFLATALLLVVPGRATNPPTFNLNSSNSSAASVSLPSGGTQVAVASSLDPTTEITFGTSTVYSANSPSGTTWLAINGVPTSSPLNGLTTPATLNLTFYSTAGFQSGQTYTATVTLTATSPAGVTAGTITVTYAVGSTSGGTITASQTSVSLTAAVGATNSTNIGLTGNASTTFTVQSATIPAGGTWLGAAVTSGYTTTLPSYVTISVSAVGLAASTYNGTVTLTPSGGGSATVINVTFTVTATAGNGNLTASPNPISWSFTTGSGVYPQNQLVGLTSSTGATTYTAIVGSSSTWLNANGGSYTSGQISAGITLSPNPTYMSALTTGTTGAVYVTDSNGNAVTITVNLTVNGGTSSGITSTPNPVTLSAAVGGSTVSQTVGLSSSIAGTFTASISGSGLYVSGVSTTTTTPASGSVIVYGNPSGLSANTYTGSLYVTLTPTSGNPVYQTVTVSFVVGSGGTTTTNGVVTPASLTFAYQTGTTVTALTMPSQSVAVTGTGTFTVGTPTYPTAYTGSPWVTVTPTSGYAPGTFSVSVNPTAAGLVASATPYTASIPVTVNSSSSSTVSVSLLITSSAVLVTYPGTINLSYTAGGSAPYATLYLNASDSSAIPVSATTSATWLTVSSPGGPTTNTALSIQGSNLSSLANGVYTGSVVVTATGAANSPWSVPVLLTVSGSSVSGGSLTLSPSSMTFSAVQNGSAPASQPLSVSASSATSYTATASSTGNWLSISPSGSLTTNSNPTLTVSVNQSGLTANTYTGTITLQATNGVTQAVTVTLVVSTSSGGGGNVTASPTSLSFIYTVGGGTPAAQNLQVTSASGSASVQFTISSSATWLSAGVANGSSLGTPVTFTVSLVTPISLTASSTPYTATINIAPTGGTAVSVPVSLTVQAAPTVTATPTTLSFAYQAGSGNPASQTVSVSGGGASLGFTAAVTSGNNWLSVSPTSGTTPTTGSAALAVTATPGTLGAGSYTGTILVSATGSATGSTSISVGLTVTATLPTINSVVNAASSIRGSISPGEIVTIYGTAMGPATPAYASIDPSTGKLATTIGGVQVLFQGTAAPMIYASNTQVNAIVPYEMAPIASPSVLIKYLGQTSNGYQLTSTTTAPGLFTQNMSGTGPGAILNQDYSLNAPGNGAAKGSVVMVYLTGEGQTSPKGVTGQITTATLPAPQVTPAPLLAVGVLINGQPANYTYAGEAPGLAAGLMQLNVQIPATAPSGSLPIQVLIGGNISQPGVTVTVK